MITEPGMLPTPFARPLYIMAKPAGPTCNLACEYCYYLEKAGLFDGAAKKYMSDATLERFIKTYIEAQSTAAVQFTWHGGEALLRSLDFFRKAMRLQKEYAGGRRIDNCLQTNGTLLTDEWCRFLRENNWLVGISIDGPEEFHDEYRRSRDGRPSFQRVMKGINMLKKYGVEWNAMAVVNDYNADYPEEFYNFFKEIGCEFLQFTPIVERIKHDGKLAENNAEATLAPFSITPEQWGDFLCKIFDMWVMEDVGRVFVQLFDATLANYVGQAPGICTMAKTCGHAGVVEHNGDVYSCDHFVFPDYYLGNIHDTSVMEMFGSPKQLKFGKDKYDTLPRRCLECKWLKLCYGECPKNRFAITPDGEAGLNYLCEGYRKFFAHTVPYFEFMANELREGRAPANVMKFAHHNPPKA